MDAGLSVGGRADKDVEARDGISVGSVGEAGCAMSVPQALMISARTINICQKYFGAFIK